MINKEYRDMADEELREALKDWCDRVDNAGGWSSAYFSAKQVAAICAEAARRGLPDFENPRPIKFGS